MKILHIHSDSKFIVESALFYSNTSIDNTIIYLGDSLQNNNSVVCIPFSRRNADIIAAKASGYDIVILYSLRLEHAIICNRIDKRVVVMWRFFGGELYQLMGIDLLSPESKRYYKKAPLHHILSVIKNTLLYSTSAEQAFKKAVMRSDYFMGLSDMEYVSLKERFNNLPPFIQLPYIRITPDSELTPKKDIVILGHSRDIYGNHLELMNRLDSSNLLDNYNYVMFFSYGEYSKEYSKAILDIASNYTSIRVISDFLDRSEYESIVKTSSAMVINSYRQMGMGNVIQALRNGIKVYLNEKNVMYGWLLKEGFLVFTVEEFLRDISNRNAHLSKEQAMKNRVSFNNLVAKYSVEEFCGRLITLKQI